MPGEYDEMMAGQGRQEEIVDAGLVTSTGSVSTRTARFVLSPVQNV